MATQRHNRVVATALYLAIIFLVHWLFVGAGFPIDQKVLWLVNGVASLLLGSRLLNPHFTPPADVATNAFFAGGTMIAALATKPTDPMDFALILSSFAVCGIILAGALFVLIVKKDSALENRLWVSGIERAVRGVGSPRVIFTGVILSMVWLFHRDTPTELFVILAIWTLIVALDPIEAALDYVDWIGRKSLSTPINVLGLVAGYQNPGLVLVRQHSEARHPPGTLMVISDDHGPTTLGVALNYVGRDDGMLLRSLSLPVPPALKSKVEAASVGGAAAVLLDVDIDEQHQITVLERISTLCGIVDSDSSLEFLQIEVTNDANLTEGRLVDVKIGSEIVIYQLVDGLTREDAVQQKNKYGYVRAKARKIGIWDARSERFKSVAWLPRINAPVFLKNTNEFIPNADAIGHFPKTDYQISINISEAVTHNTAILGILGIGKSFLAIELVERMIHAGMKVICLDLTDQYAELLSEFVDERFQSAADKELAAAGMGSPVGKSKEEGGSVHAFRRAVVEQVGRFLGEDCSQHVRIINPANFRVSRQASGWDEKTAGFTDLTPTEITAIVSDATLRACQSMGMTDRARVCLIYEEAHSLVPEWNSVASDGDKSATAATARAILQGRKFGLGCLLITQRTANVTKTILNQCNTIFAMRTFDDTGKEFLGNYIGSEYARVLPSLKERHAVFFGKASSCDDPVLIRLNDRDQFVAAFRSSDST